MSIFAFLSKGSKWGKEIEKIKLSPKSLGNFNQTFKIIKKNYKKKIK